MDWFKQIPNYRAASAVNSDDETVVNVSLYEAKKSIRNVTETPPRSEEIKRRQLALLERHIAMVRRLP